MAEIEVLTEKRRQILEVIEASVRERGFPPSVREIGEAVGLTSSSTVHSHLRTLKEAGFLRIDATKPRAIEVRWHESSDEVVELKPARHVPLLGDVAAGVGVLAQENIEELMPLPEQLTGNGKDPVFMLRVRGESMIEAGILPGDLVVVRQQSTAERNDVVVAGIPGEEATIKTLAAKSPRVVLMPANSSMAPIELQPSEVTIYGKVISVLRQL